MNRIDTLRSYLDKNPGDSFLLHAMALEWVKMGNDAEARSTFEQLLAANPAYIGSYYHLGKLLERNGDTTEAIKVYEQGMTESKKAGDNHAFNELQAAHEDLVYS